MRLNRLSLLARPAVASADRIARKRSPLRTFLRHLHRNQSGLALTEFAFSLPIFIGLGMYGTEISYLAVVNMQMSQAAINLADNASRIGQASSSIISPTIKESDILNVFAGTKLQGDRWKLFENGRVIISSLERNTLGGQWIRWQRCKGKGRYNSAYGPQLTGATSTPLSPTFPGMGPTRRELTASSGTAVMYVELYYKYEGLFGDLFIKNRMLRQEAAHNIRDDRNLTLGIVNDSGGQAATCDKFDAT